MNTEEQLQNTIAMLVRASQSGERTALDRLVALTQKRAMQVAIGMLHDRDEAAEALQQGYVKAYLNIRKLREPNYFETWLFRIVANEALARRKTLARKMKTAKIDDGYEAGTTASPVESAIGNDLDNAIKRAMLKLSKKEAIALALFGIENMSQAEVAQAMKCSTESVRWHVFQARQKMRKLLEGYL